MGNGIGLMCHTSATGASTAANVTLPEKLGVSQLISSEPLLDEGITAVEIARRDESFDGKSLAIRWRRSDGCNSITARRRCKRDLSSRFRSRPDLRMRPRLDLTSSSDDNESASFKCPVENRGVTVAWLEQFCEKISGVPELRGRPEFTTAEVVEHFVRPATKPDSCCYHQFERLPVAAPDIFVSHTWKRPFREVVACLTRRFSGDVVVWLDIISVNQHRGEHMTADLKGLTRVIEQSQRTVAVVDPEGLCFSRAWCLLEMHKAASSKQETQSSTGGQGLNYAGCVGKLELLTSLVARCDEETISNIIYNLNIEWATATNEEDALRIKALIEKETGTAEFNGLLKRAIVQGLSSLVEVLATSEQQDLDEVGSLAALVGMIMNRQGMYHEAATMSARAASLMMRNSGLSETVQVAHALNNAALSQYLGGNYKSAEEGHMRVLKLRERLLGSAHPEVALSVHNLARAKMAMRNTREAELLMQRALAILEAQYGPNGMEVAPVLNSLGALFLEEGNQGRICAAEACLQRALKINKTHRGDSHPDTAASIFEIGKLSQAQGNLAQATSHFQQALSVWEITMGPCHPNTAEAMAKLGGLFLIRRDCSLEADAMLQHSVECYRNLYGLNNVKSAAVQCQLAEAKLQLGHSIDAMDLLISSLRVFVRQLGNHHPETIAAVKQIANVFTTTGNCKAASSVLNVAATLIRENKVSVEADVTSLDRDIDIAKVFGQQERYSVEAIGRPSSSNIDASIFDTTGAEHPVDCTIGQLLSLQAWEGHDDAFSGSLDVQIYQTMAGFETRVLETLNSPKGRPCDRLWNSATDLSCVERSEISQKFGTVKARMNALALVTASASLR